MAVVSIIVEIIFKKIDGSHVSDYIFKGFIYIVQISGSAYHLTTSGDMSQWDAFSWLVQGVFDTWIGRKSNLRFSYKVFYCAILYQDSEAVAKDEVQKVLLMTEERRRLWERTWEEQRARLEQNLQMCQFYFDLRQVFVILKEGRRNVLLWFNATAYNIISECRLWRIFCNI